MFLSLEMYILAPPLHRTLAATTPPTAALLLVALIATALGMLATTSVVLTSSFLCTIGCITWLCPMWLIRIQKFKAKINGPWDIAAPQLLVGNTSSRGGGGGGGGGGFE